MIVLLILGICILSIITGFYIGYKRCYLYADRRIEELEKSAFAAQIRAKYWQMFLQLQKKECSFRSFFDRNDMHRIAIYGYGLIGKHLEEELMKEGIKVSFAVDRSTKNNTVLTVYTPKEKLPEYDVMIVTTGNAKEVQELVGGTVNTVIELENILRVV